MLAAPHHVITLAEYHRMIDGGAFASDARIELIEGELLEKSPMGSRHWRAVTRLNERLVQALIGRPDLLAASQVPISLPPHDEPEPDAIICRRTSDKPVPIDVLLVVEVSDSTLYLNRTIKLPLYARHGIPEAWLLDLVEDRLEIHTRPSPTGYQEVRRITRGTPVCIPPTSVALVWDELF